MQGYGLNSDAYARIKVAYASPSHYLLAYSSMPQSLAAKIENKKRLYYLQGRLNNTHLGQASSNLVKAVSRATKAATSSGIQTLVLRR